MRAEKLALETGPQMVQMLLGRDHSLRTAGPGKGREHGNIKKRGAKEGWWQAASRQGLGLEWTGNGGGRAPGTLGLGCL